MTIHDPRRLASMRARLRQNEPGRTRQVTLDPCVGDMTTRGAGRSPRRDGVLGQLLPGPEAVSERRRPRLCGGAEIVDSDFTPLFQRRTLGLGVPAGAVTYRVHGTGRQRISVVNTRLRTALAAGRVKR
jgi:hypothetical protein